MVSSSSFVVSALHGPGRLGTRARQPANLIAPAGALSTRRHSQRRCLAPAIVATTGGTAAPALRRAGMALPPVIRVAAAVRRLSRMAKRNLTTDSPGWRQPDEGKEAARREQRSQALFTHHRWAVHRSGDRYMRHLLSIADSRTAHSLATPLLATAAAAALVCGYEEALAGGALPASLPSLLLPRQIFDMTSFALSLLLVFRTEASYNRWQAASAAWATISTRSRDAVRQLLAGTRTSRASSSGAPAPEAAAAGRWLVAFARAMRAELTPDSDLRTELQSVLTPAELDLLCSAHHPPSFALMVLAEVAANAPVTDACRARLAESLSQLEEAVGSCQQLLRTPIPLSYTRHTSRCLVTWLAALPLGLWSDCGWAALPITVAVSFLLLGIEEIGVSIEEPFTVMPLDALCHQLEAGVADVVGQAAAAEAAAAAAVAAAAGASTCGAATAPWASDASRSPAPTGPVSNAVAFVPRHGGPRSRRQSASNTSAALPSNRAQL